MDREIAEAIVQVVKEKKPETVEQLLTLVREKLSIPDSQIIEHIIRLHEERRINLAKTPKSPKSPSRDLTTYLKTQEAYWYWITIVLAVAAALTVFMVPEDSYPLIYVRYSLGAILVLWLPGYSLTKALFPVEPPFKTKSETVDSIVLATLSVCLSIALTPTVCLLLNYTPWGVRLTPIVLSLFTLTAVLSTAAVVRELKVKIEKANEWK